VLALASTGFLLSQSALGAELASQPCRQLQSGAARAQAAPCLDLSPATLARFAGKFYSEKLDATYELSAAGSTLVLRRARARPDTLIARDSITMDGSVGTLRFTLGPGGRAGAFALNGGRVQNIEFVRR
jgi:hypothetical protein